MMNAIDFTPLFRSSVGFDRMASLLNNAMGSDPAPGYPPYNIEMLEENQYAITIAVAGFSRSDLSIEVEKNVLTVSGEKSDQAEAKYLYQGIADRRFERRFNLADHVEVTSADLADGLLTIKLLREIPESLKPKSIMISSASDSKVKRLNQNKPTVDDEAA